MMVYPALANLLVLRREFSTSAGMMLTLRADSCTLCRSLFLAMAGAIMPLGRWNTIVDSSPIARDGPFLRNALDVALVSLTADGIVLFNAPSFILLVCKRGLVGCRVCLLGGCLRRPHWYSVLSLSM